MSATLDMPLAATARDYTQQLEESAASLAAVRQRVATKLAPKVVDVDLKAEYPESFLRELGAIGGFRGAMAPEFGGNGLGLKHVVQVMEEVARQCLSSGFLVWCQTACARYIQMSDNAALKQSFLPRIARGEVLAGTGLSNTVKSCDTIEDFRLSARKVEGGYVINGVLPWVSNLGPTHYFTTGCPVVRTAAWYAAWIFRRSWPPRFSRSICSSVSPCASAASCGFWPKKWSRL